MLSYNSIVISISIPTPKALIMLFKLGNVSSLSLINLPSYTLIFVLGSNLQIVYEINAIQKTLIDAIQGGKKNQ